MAASIRAEAQIAFAAIGRGAFVTGRGRALITRQGAARAALELIDEAGLESFSLPQLARRVGVSSPSLYHHFADRSEVLAAVARLVYEEAVMPRFPRSVDDWPDWVVQTSVNLRRAVLRHANAAPILLQFLPRDLVTQRYDIGSEFLRLAGVPLELHIELLDGIEKISLGGVVAEALRPPAKRSEVFPLADPDEFPSLAAAMAANEHSTAELHEQIIRSFLHGVITRGTDRSGSTDF